MSKNDPILECVDNTGITGLILTPDINKWRVVIDGKRIVPASGIIRLPKDCKLKKLLVFVKIKEDGDSDELDKGLWRDIRKFEVEGKGKPFVVPESGNISVPDFCSGKPIKIFVEVTED